MTSPLKENSITLLSVSFGSEPFLQLNREYLRALNPYRNPPWYVVNNSNKECVLPKEHFTVFPGSKEKSAQTKGLASFHHAEGLHIGMNQPFSSRFLLILDPDFYLIKPNWIEKITSFMVENGLSLFGSTWHPSQSEKYRYFPSVHCLFIDATIIDVHSLSFRPEIDKVPLKKKIANRLPQGSLLCRMFRVGTSRDTGYQIFRRYFGKKKLRYDCFTPFFNPSTMAFIASKILPEAFSIIPKKSRYYSRERFLPSIGCDCPWEEFFWQGKPIAFHFRNLINSRCTENNLIEARKILSKIS